MSGLVLSKRWLPAHLLLLWMLNNISESRVYFFAPDAVTLEEYSKANITITSSSPINNSAVIHLNVTYSSKWNYSSIITVPDQVLLPLEATSVSFNVTTHDVGQVTTYVLSNNTDLNSVVGLNFDFLALNLTGFIAYSVFNIGLFWVPYIKEEFLKRNPNGIDPVSANDVFFSLHAVLLCFIYIIQAAVYERGGQKVSWTAIILLLIGWTFALVSLFLAAAKQITWLDCLYYFSYIKLAVTLIKYAPQAYMNYRRQSTEGWSIGNVLLDFTGGTLSILQMILESYNNDEWRLIFGDPTKFGLGLFSVVFDVLFMTQHYCLYRQPPQYEAVGEQQED
ncbi:cystinosin isoform X2 [Micropterus dolomieu]|uniref:cystinosin isoform X2 n=1 Tax=Micropterus dolomieu TaxID=147949 RepID=UPI001E8EDDA4|nr:cystinosin isoform X2 [Micropterus dolomieu]